MLLHKQDRGCVFVFSLKVTSIGYIITSFVYSSFYNTFKEAILPSPSDQLPKIPGLFSFKNALQTSFISAWEDQIHDVLHNVGLAERSFWNWFSRLSFHSGMYPRAGNFQVEVEDSTRNFSDIPYNCHRSRWESKYEPAVVQKSLLFISL